MIYAMLTSTPTPKKIFVGELEKITREGRIRRTRKEVMGYVKSVVRNNNFLLLFEYGQNKEICSCSLVYLNEKRRLKWRSQYHTSPKKKKAHC